ncbi:hypothetical protein D3C71_1660870 [compost metagenome]
MHFGTEVFARVGTIVAIANDKTRRGEGTRAHLVEEAPLTVMVHLQRHTALGVLVDRDLIALLAQLDGDLLAGRLDHFFDETPDMGAPGQHGDVAQAPLPAAVGMPRMVLARQRLGAQPAPRGVQAQRLEQTPDGRQQNDREWQRTGDRRGLQRLQAVGQQQRDRYHADAH